MVEPRTGGLLVAEAVGAIIAFLAAKEVLASYRMVGALSLRRLGTGFVLLGSSQVALFIMELLVYRAADAIPANSFDVFDVLFWLHYGTLLVGLVFVFRSFGRHPFKWSPVLSPILLKAGPVLEMLTILVLFFVVLHAGLNHMARKARGSILVSVGFFFVFTAHSLSLIGYTVLNPRWLVAELANLVGFLILYFAVRRPRSRNDA